MSLRTLSDVKLRIDEKESALFEIARKKLGKKPAHFAIKKKSLDARDKSNIRYVYTIEFSDKPFQPTIEPLERLPKNKIPARPVVVVGSGPAGLFCALRLLQRGITPMLIERGQTVEKRAESIRVFQTKGELSEESNVQFGEGGAGTFSDGKLNTQTHDKRNREVLETFVRFGAPEEILWLNKPHIGSDNLKKVVKNVREYLLSQGVEIRFETRLDDVQTVDGNLKSITVYNAERGEERIEVSALVLAIGHSARDTVEKLLSRGVKMQAKDFAVGVRIEHLQSRIGFAQYGKAYEKLPPAEYKLVSHIGERSAFTFCMCPGGVVMPATSEKGCVVTNGMSDFARDKENANSALIVQVRKSDFSGEDPLAGVRFQREIERKAYIAGGENYRAPVQRVEDFLKDKASAFLGEVKPSYGAGTQLSDMRAVLPTFICDTLKASILQMDKKLLGFAHADAILTGAETRTSSPVRIERNAGDLQAVGVRGLYPAGEGAGYAGGITSAGADGMRVADAVFNAFLKIV